MIGERIVPAAFAALAVGWWAGAAVAEAPAGGQGDGLAGAALCVAAADHLAANGDAAASKTAATWRKIMEAVSADTAARDAAVETARAGLTGPAGSPPGMALITARSVAPSCVGRDAQIRYLTRFGKPELMGGADAPPVGTTP